LYSTLQTKSHYAHGVCVMICVSVLFYSAIIRWNYHDELCFYRIIKNLSGSDRQIW